MLTFLAGLLALPFVIWLLLLIDFIAITTLVEYEEGVWATVVAIGSIIGLNYLWKLHLLDTIKANPGHTALLVLSYFVIGVFWSVYLKFSLCRKKNHFVVRKTWTFIFELLQSTYQRIANYVFRGATADAAMAKEYEAQKVAKQAALDVDEDTRGSSRRGR